MLNFWKTTNVLSLILAPWGWVYGQAARIHGLWRAKNPYYAAAPVISIGNITVGGTGKTPITEWLAREYTSQGYTVAIVSRGYGGSETGWPQRVNPNEHTSAQVGDEPLMLAQKLNAQGVQVWVGKNRPAVVARAEQAGATLILLDDGFQRRDVARNVDIVVVDGPTGFGNAHPMPAGPLREPLKGLARASFAIILNPIDRKQLYPGLLAYRLTSSTSLPEGSGKSFVAFAGIGNPTKFQKALSSIGADIKTYITFPDHHPYTPKDLSRLQTLSKAHHAPLLTTEKDATRLPQGFALTAPMTLHGDDKENILAEIAKHIS